MKATLIRKATIEDMLEIHNLVVQLAIFEKEESEVATTVEEFKRDYNNNCFDCLILAREGKLIGMALYYMAYSTWKGRMLFLEDLYIDVNYRNLGLGQKLFDAVLSTAKEEGCRIVKWQVLDWNKGAIRFYERNDAEFSKGWWNVRVLI